MKTPLLSFGFFYLLAVPAFAQQIIITQEDFATPSDTVRLSISLPSTPVNLTGTGVNQTWDFSALTPIRQEVTSFVSVGSSGYSASFPPTSANVASPVAIPTIIQENLGEIQLTNTHLFYLKNDTVFQETGMAGTVQSFFPIPLAIPYESPDVLYRLPLIYDQRDSSEAYFEVDYYSLFQIYFAENRKRVNHVDGWGTLTTPFGTFGALRMVSTIYTTDSVRTSDIPGTRIQLPVSREYKWLGKNQKLPLLQINTSMINNQETVTAILYRDQNRNLTPLATTAESGVAAIQVFPSPLPNAADLMVRLPADASRQVEIAVYNPVGQVVYHRAAGEAGIQDGFLRIPAVLLGSEKGMYLVRIQSGENVTVKKIIRQ